MVKVSSFVLVLVTLLLTACGPEISEKLELKSDLVRETAVSELTSEAMDGQPSAVMADLLQVSDQTIQLSGHPGGLFSPQKLDAFLKSPAGAEYTGQNFFLYASFVKDAENPMMAVLNFPGTDVKFSTMLGVAGDAEPQELLRLLSCMHISGESLMCSSVTETLALRQMDDFGVAESVAKQVFIALTDKTKLEVPEKYLVFAKGVANAFFKQANLTELGSKLGATNCSEYFSKSALMGLRETHVLDSCISLADELPRRNEAIPYLKKMDEREQAISKVVFGSLIAEPAVFEADVGGDIKSFFAGMEPLEIAIVVGFLLLACWFVYGIVLMLMRSRMTEDVRAQKGALFKTVLKGLSVGLVGMVGAYSYLETGLYDTLENSLLLVFVVLICWCVYGIVLAKRRSGQAEEVWSPKKQNFKRVLIGLNIVFVANAMGYGYLDDDIYAACIYGLVAAVIAVWVYLSGVLVSRRHDEALGQEVKRLTVIKVVVGLITALIYFGLAWVFLIEEGDYEFGSVPIVLGLLHFALVYWYLGRPKQVTQEV